MMDLLSSAGGVANELIDTSSHRSLSSIETAHFQTPFYEVMDFGFLCLTSTEQYETTWYPTPSDVMPGGWFSLELDNAAYGDFNGDGLQDLMVHPMLFPHVVQRETRIDPIFLLQKSDGSFEDPQSINKNASFPEKFFEYRTGVGDFNGDGIDDISIATMGIPSPSGGADLASRIFNAESPLTVYGSREQIRWTDSYQGLSLFQGAPDWQIGYNTGHSMAVGDFNGDGLSDWFSDGYVLMSEGQSFIAHRYVPNADAANRMAPWDNPWTWPIVNACTSADFNEDGYDDLIYSTMPRVDSNVFNGGDLYLISGSQSGLIEGSEVTKIPRANAADDNIGTNFVVAADFNGDSHQDLIFVEHGWVTDSGNSSHYYSQGKLRLFLGDGKGNLSESTASLNDPFSGYRTGEGNLYAEDINGDGWTDLVLSGYGYNKDNQWSTSSQDFTSIFVNQNGVLQYIPTSSLAYVEPYQLAGEESVKEWAQNGIGKMFPVDIGDDGLMDFVGFVKTPLHQWPQIEQQYTYAYISKALSPLGRISGSESLMGTLGEDKIFGYLGDDRMIGSRGDDVLNGGEGLDSSIYSGVLKEYVINKHSSTVVDKQPNRDGKDTVLNIERLKFIDLNWAFDTEAGQVSGEAYRLYKAAFDRTPDADGIGFWINALDKGAALTEIARGFITSDEFQRLYGANVSDRDYITKLYNNVLDRNPDQSGYEFWLTALTHGATKEDIMVNFSESNENIAKVSDLISNGISYQEWLG